MRHLGFCFLCTVLKVSADDPQAQVKEPPPKISVEHVCYTSRDGDFLTGFKVTALEDDLSAGGKDAKLYCDAEVIHSNCPNEHCPPESAMKYPQEQISFECSELNTKGGYAVKGASPYTRYALTIYLEQQDGKFKPVVQEVFTTWSSSAPAKPNEAMRRDPTYTRSGEIKVMFEANPAGIATSCFEGLDYYFAVYGRDKEGALKQMTRWERGDISRGIVSYVKPKALNLQTYTVGYKAVRPRQLGEYNFYLEGEYESEIQLTEVLVTGPPGSASGEYVWPRLASVAFAATSEGLYYLQFGISPFFKTDGREEGSPLWQQTIGYNLMLAQNSGNVKAMVQGYAQGDGELGPIFRTKIEQIPPEPKIFNAQVLPAVSIDDAKTDQEKKEAEYLRDIVAKVFEEKYDSIPVSVYYFFKDRTFEPYQVDHPFNMRIVNDCAGLTTPLQLADPVQRDLYTLKSKVLIVQFPYPDMAATGGVGLDNVEYWYRLYPRGATRQPEDNDPWTKRQFFEAFSPVAEKTTAGVHQQLYSIVVESQKLNKEFGKLQALNPRPDDYEKQVKDLVKQLDENEKPFRNLNRQACDGHGNEFDSPFAMYQATKPGVARFYLKSPLTLRMTEDVYTNPLEDLALYRLEVKIVHRANLPCEPNTQDYQSRDGPVTDVLVGTVPTPNSTTGTYIWPSVEHGTLEEKDGEFWLHLKVDTSLRNPKQMLAILQRMKTTVQIKATTRIDPYARSHAEATSSKEQELWSSAQIQMSEIFEGKKVKINVRQESLKAELEMKMPTFKVSLTYTLPSYWAIPDYTVEVPQFTVLHVSPMGDPGIALNPDKVGLASSEGEGKSEL